MASRRGPDNSVRVAISGSFQTRSWANVFHAQLTTAGVIAQADLDTWLTAFANAYKTRFSARQSAPVTYLSAQATLYAPGGGQLSSVSTMTGTGALAGTRVEDSSACVVISWVSSVYWRGGKPRTYMIGLVEADINNDYSLSATAITNWKTAANNFRADVNALTATSITGTQLGFVSFRSGNADRATPIFFPVSGSQVHPRFGTQRRRLGKWSR